VILIWNGCGAVFVVIATTLEGIAEELVPQLLADS
jgi:hypothetical protein